MSSVATPVNEPDHLSHIPKWFKKLRPSKVMAVALAIAVLSSGVAVWFAISSAETPLSTTSQTLTTLSLINAGLLVILFFLIGRRVLGLWRTMRAGEVGSRLQTRIVLVFGLVTIIPTIMVSLFSGLLFHFGIQSWFDDRIATALEKSVAVAEVYLDEHKETIRADALAMANDIRRELPVLMTAPHNFQQIIDAQAALRNLTEAIVFTPKRVVARTQLSFSLTFERLPSHVMEQVDVGDIVILADEDNKIRAVLKLDDLADVYLMIGRIVDSKVIDHMLVSQGAVNEYRKLRGDITDIQFQFSLLFVLVALLLLLSAIWYGIYVAIELIVPITRLISAAEQVRAGDFDTRVPVSGKEDELSQLARTFNRMTSQLSKQRSELVEANRQLDMRRRFTEAIFAGVSAGVVALDREFTISLNNRTAAELLQNDPQQSLKGMPIKALMPDIAELLKNASSMDGGQAEANVTFLRGEKKLNLHVRVTAELNDKDIEGYIVTFDDITELVSAQRSAAWADVAKRIAHEIKNPLTPITLSVERLRRKYMEQLESEEDRESFKRYTDTIARHTADIGQMVEEFVSFARMPAAVMVEHDITNTLRDAVFSARTAFPDVVYSSDIPKDGLIMKCDERQLGQLMTNLLKNAAEGIESRFEEEPDGPKGEVSLNVTSAKSALVITIEDNGIGFPADKINQLTEPYVTTRAKGTGLGLAIVKKHVEAHKGTLTLENRESGGARVILRFAKRKKDAEATG
ncbi:MAG: PAS domain-containing sensor histidine kinase [Rickettsiales bacterium]|nr:PAS domain-containing sensor histidine kinase [Rickettsiales bacterium]